MEYFVYLLAAIGATGNAESIPNPSSQTSLSRPDPKPKGNPGNWATTNDYPSSALQQEREGTTGFRVTVGPDGRVIDCVITESSGSSDLDMNTCTNVRRRARFEPALDSNGKPTTGKYANRVRWQIPGFVPQTSFPRGPMMHGSTWARVGPTDFPPLALAEKRSGKVKIELAISPSGTVDGCKVIESSTHTDLDAESCKVASTKAKFGAALDITGQPTAGRVQTELNWRIAADGALPTGGAVAPFTMPKELRPKAGVSSVSFVVAADGSLVDCKGQTTMDVKLFVPDELCKGKIKMEAYTDTAGKPVARRVIVKTSIEVVDIK